ncbi:hypothetical protein [Wolbachia endosymbiont of Folsomia candida]|uniref:hypothetical protein n=1 Tax=Wolbachia endosymbiont of Folsomia candida TaxID=169402 RepID=UPI000B60BC57|nr:hypothetical protein [Wolbachia endosymbiont of Folsomia candida]APR98641.1 hypothetical protein ASM33_05325 [Wolbachia endosymbiont of Folsomia candida]
MALQFSQKQVAANILGSSDSWIDPQSDYLKTAAYLAGLGFIRLKEVYFVICAREEDHLDWPHVFYSDCSNEIPINLDFDEECDDMLCEDCCRYILPNTHQKKRFHLLSANLNLEKIADWFENLLRTSQLIWRKAAEGIYHVSCHDNIVSIIVLDLCTDPVHLTIDKLRIQPTVLIDVRERIPDLPLALPIVKMTDLFCEHKTLNEILSDAVNKGVPELITNTSSQIFPIISLKETKPALPKKALQLQFTGGVVYINDIEVVNKRAKLCISIFDVLFKQFLHDFSNDVPKEEHKPLSIEKIAERLNFHAEITDLEQQIRYPINKMQRTIKEKLANQLGLGIEREDVIQTIGWPELACKEYGYRLNPFTLTLKK